MRGKKVKFIIYGLIAVIAIGIFVVIYVYNYVGVKNDFCMITTHPNIHFPEAVAAINGTPLAPANEFYDEKTEIPDLNNGEYGEMFEIDYHFLLTRLLKKGDYVVEMRPDYSKLSEDEMIFWASFSGGGWRSGQGVFACDGYGYEANDYLALYGCTYGYSQDKIKEICKKVRINVWIEGENGRVRKKVIKPTGGFEEGYGNEDETLEALIRTFGA